MVAAGGSERPRRRRRKKASNARAVLPSARPELGLWLKIGGVLVALGTVAAVVWDVVDPLTGGGSAAGRQGLTIGGVVGTAARTLLLGALAAILWAKGRAYADPARFAPSVLARQSLEHAAAALRDHVVDPSFEPTRPYAESTDEELVSIYETIDRERVPDRFNELVVEIRRRTRGAAANRP